MADEAPATPKWHWLWDVYIVGVCGVAIIAVFLLNDLLPGNPAAAAALLIAMAAWALTAGRWVSRVGELN